MAPPTVAVLVGSIRKDSFNRKIALALKALARGKLDLALVDIAGVSFFNQDLEGAPPADWVRLRAAIKSADAVLFVTPEYNRSVPGVLKNAVDVASRPYGQSVFDGKPAAIISASPGAIGAFGANHHLRQMLTFLNMPALQQPEMYLNHVGDWFDEAGNLKNEEARKLLEKFVGAFAKWVETHAGA
ncbi:MAG: NADPH-dependent FMN reductase [Hyphomonadaceae bacterium]